MVSAARSYAFRSSRRASQLEQARQMRRHRRADEPRRGEDECQQPTDESCVGLSAVLSPSRIQLGRLVFRLGHARPGHFRQTSIERHAHYQVQRGPGKTGSSPAELCLQESRERPTNGAGEACQQGDACDCAARIMSVDTHERGKPGPDPEPWARRASPRGNRRMPKPASERSRGPQRSGAVSFRPSLRRPLHVRWPVD